MEIIVLNAALLLIVAWYAFRSGALWERAKWERKTQEGSDY